jgi:hypothetical protein
VTDLGRLIVETEATLFTAFDTRASLVAQVEVYNGGVPDLEHLKAARDRARESAANEARRIVAAVYGLPCASPERWRLRPTPVGFMGPPCHDSVPAPTGAATDVCSRCSWPRLEHGRPS